MVLLGSILSVTLLVVSPPNAQAQMTYDEVYAAAADHFGPGPISHYVTRIARCESNWKPYARKSGFDPNFINWRTGRWGTPYDFVGLMQVDWYSHRERVINLIGVDDPQVLHQPWVNMLVAHSILKDQGWGAWPWCSQHA